MQRINRKTIKIMKKLLSVMLLAVVAMTAMAQKEIVWENPTAFMG